ncbi:MmcQ/YjbR family DNA-binding protein [Sphingomonas sp. DC1600-2]|uniref:MmcQ/YjbR family DNA-binding protein n=1 Tax=unclassified Sphingomonas TaxID=196159 RepID=UPI003CE74C40
MKDWESLAAFALTLPDTVAGTHYGGPAIKVASNGRAFVSIGSEAGSFVLSIDSDTKEMLLETDPATFWQTPHYEGWPAVLVRYDSADPTRVQDMISRARDQAAARKAAKPRKKA